MELDAAKAVLGGKFITLNTYILNKHPDWTEIEKRTN